MGLNFYIPLSGLRAGEKMIQVAQNNIANAHNTSYARQRVEANATNYPAGVSGINAQLGTGVSIEQITRVRDELIIQQSRTEGGTIGYHSAIKDVLSNIETIYNETSTNSISDLMNGLFNSFEEASKYPEQSSYRLNTAYAGKMFAEKIRGVANQLDEVKSQTDRKLTTEVERVNELISKIANVNQKMENIYSDKANALMDERDKYLDELSSYIDVEVVHKSSPMNMEIKVGNATLLSGKNKYNIDAMYVPSTDKWVLAASDIEFKPKSGSLAGIIEARDVNIPKYEKELNELVKNIIKEVNTLQESGYDLKGSKGVQFFKGGDIRTIEINSELIDNPNKLALSGKQGVIGNADIGKALADLKSKPFMDGKSPINYYQGYTIRLASDLNIARESELIHIDVQQAMESQRQEIQGVSTDEEMTDLMVFQKYYQANAKTLKIVDSMLNDLLSIL
ncbi:flagellar hook-associated protein FlgK [Bacillus cereus]|uniref:flagellar hook-associated protein FlgK n=1 Tax=Bacillus cereus TaxID=1396 RepID=UPI000B4AC2F5|nr:flagellar hook-associated protein FlgK [Bacillus cereus]